MATAKTSTLKTVLLLEGNAKNGYKATVTVTLPDSCYHAGDLKVGLPPNTVGIPEIEYLTFSVSHDEGKVCAENLREVTKTIDVPFNNAKPTATAYVTVNGKISGSDTKPFPK